MLTAKAAYRDALAADPSMAPFAEPALNRIAAREKAQADKERERELLVQRAREFPNQR
ncbi:MAG: hypothetical protein HY736_25045 [Verrucomicrobia bacterium]|nr:hypothetical protein [Verrucomicrobiota bacterium]